MTCRTCYRVELLAVPTTAQMQTALLAGTTEASLVMLRAGDAASQAASRQVIELIRSAGAPSYGAADLRAALTKHGHLPGTKSAQVADQACELALAALSVQFEAHAREWFLANVVRIGLADGALSAGERQAVRVIAKALGMTQAQAQDVIWLTEEAAQAG